MKGLLLKDFYMAVKYCRSFLLIIAVFLGLSVVGRGNTFMLTYPVLLASVIPVTLISYDERSRWNAYAATLPCTRAQLVSAKYLLMLTLLGACLLLVGVAQGVRMALSGAMDWPALLTGLSLLALLGIASPSILLPVVFKLGAEKGRLAYYIVLVGFCIAATCFPDVKKLLPQSTLSGAGLSLLAVALAAALLLLSWRLSIRFYRAKEL